MQDEWPMLLSALLPLQLPGWQHIVMPVKMISVTPAQTGEAHVRLEDDGLETRSVSDLRDMSLLLGCQFRGRV